METEFINDGGVLAKISPFSLNRILKENSSKEAQEIILMIHRNSHDVKSTRDLIEVYDNILLKKALEIEELERLAGEDHLTGLYTRRIFDKDLENRCKKTDIDERRKTDRRGHFSLIIYDLNNLKILNDTEGHERGDDELVNLSELIKKNLGTFDTAYRLGGDEFASIHPNTTPYQAINFAKLIYSLDVSIGISGSHILKKTNQTISSKIVYRTADQAMYYSKKSKTGPKLWNLDLLNT